MRKILLLLFCFIVTGTIMAAHVDKEQAAQNAISFINAKFKNVDASNLSFVTKAPRKNTTNNEAYYYIFNIGGNNGFVIVSGDDRTEPILGYSDKGYFDINNIPGNMKTMLDGYEEDLKTIETFSDAQVAKMVRHANISKVRNSVSPLITTSWDQATPYWNKCPQFMNEDGTDGDLAYTGCVATSMSQIMKYYNWPKTTAKAIPSYTVSYPLEDMSYGTFETEELPVVSFDWDHMKDSYSGTESYEYTDAVATLMLYAGCAVKMQYTTIASSAKDADIPVALRKYFSYDKSLKLVYRSDYTQTDWDDLIYSELAEGRPMIYNGRAVSSGHSFVCDGYEYGDFFHINWGWSGMGNGFFQLSILNPLSSGIGGSSSAEGYCMDQTAIIGITPGEAGSTEEDPEVKKCLTVTDITISGKEYDRRDNGAFRINGKHQVKVSTEDHTGTGTAYKQGLAFYDGTNYNIVVETNVATTAKTNKFPVGTTSSDYFEFGKGMPDGTYKLVPMCQLKDETEWMPDLESDRYYLEAKISGDLLTIVTHPIVDLSVKEFSFSGGEKVGSAEQVSATVTNNSVDRFYGNLYLHVGSEQFDEFSNFTSEVQADIPAGETKTIVFNYTPTIDGTQQVCLTTDEYGENILQSLGSVTIAPTEITPMVLKVDINAENAIEGVVYDNAVKFKVDVTNNGTGEYNRYVLAPLFLISKDETGKVTGGSMVTYKQQELKLGVGETKSLYFEFNNLGFGSTYSLNIYARNENNKLVNIVNKGESKYYDIRNGLVTWTADGTRKGVPASSEIVIPDDAVAASIEGLEASSVTPNSNPNCLYYIDTDATTPAGLQGCNIVKGNKAEVIALKDGFDYFCPKRFTASTITYERAFEQGRDSKTKNGWNTLVLPFAPAKVMNATDSKDIDWFHNTEEKDKNFWIGELSAVDGNELSFVHAENIKANVPYIVAVPDDSWGEVLTDLTGKKLIFSAENVELRPNTIMIASTENCLFVGSFIKQAIDNIFAINQKGSVFTMTDNANVDALHAYFKFVGSDKDASITDLKINFPDDYATTGINETTISSESKNDIIYTIEGKKIGKASVLPYLPKGIYILNNKKVLK